MHNVIKEMHVDNLTEKKARKHLHNILKLACIDDYSEEIMHLISMYIHSERLALIYDYDIPEKDLDSVKDYLNA